MMLDTYLTAQQIMEQTGLSAAELAAVPLDEYARLSGRPTPAQAAIAALDSQYEAGQPAPAPEQTPAPEVPDFGAMSLDEYAAYREASGLAARSSEGTSRASLSMAGRYSKQDAGQQSGRASFYR
jgi:hypothetical protein